MLLDNTFRSDARVEKEIHTLLSAGYNIKVACYKNENLPVNECRNGYDIKRIIDGTVVQSPYRKGYNIYIDTIVNQLLVMQYLIVHCHDFYMLHIGAAMKQKNPDIRLIYDSHEFLSGWPFYKNANTTLNKFKGYLVWRKLVAQEKFNIKHADFVLTITDSIAQKLNEYGLKNAPYVVGNYTFKSKHEKLKGNENYFHKKYDLDKDIVVLIHSGTIYKSNKQLKVLFDSLRKIQNTVLIFVGNRKRFYEVQKLVKESEKYSNFVFFHDYPSSQIEIIELISKASIGLMQIDSSMKAHKLGFSNRFVEYISAQIPVLATEQEFVVAINNKYHCVEFFNENEMKTFAESLNLIINNYKEYKKSAIKASKVMDWETEAISLLKLYQNIMLVK